MIPVMIASPSRQLHHHQQQQQRRQGGSDLHNALAQPALADCPRLNNAAVELRSSGTNVQCKQCSTGVFHRNSSPRWKERKGGQTRGEKATIGNRPSVWRSTCTRGPETDLHGRELPELEHHYAYDYQMKLSYASCEEEEAEWKEGCQGDVECPVGRQGPGQGREG
ncbi:hypothetical protein ZHAS_00017379 [Anopheles sinensis]|uniref:Uncharacterized protein n=1 Tax=Anopheles sinensis TaxID=74873 RepID=A0A084WGC3_ANOSI|nr:hypothetical protein ZHAS_00017379 [Anopheles sinensis]